MSKLFLSYRREDAGPYAFALHDRFVRRWGEDRVFWDIDSIQPGDDFVRVIDDTLAQCTVVVALIGPRWLDASDSPGVRRLDDPADFHRVEPERALERQVRVIPTLVGGARMPTPSQLPEALRMLARRHAVEISDTRFSFDVERLAKAVEAEFARVKPAGQPDQKEPSPEQERSRTSGRAGRPLSETERSSQVDIASSKNHHSRVHNENSGEPPNDGVPHSTQPLRQRAAIREDRGANGQAAASANAVWIRRVAGYANVQRRKWLLVFTALFMLSVLGFFALRGSLEDSRPNAVPASGRHPTVLVPGLYMKTTAALGQPLSRSWVTVEPGSVPAGAPAEFEDVEGRCLTRTVFAGDRLTNKHLGRCK